MTSEHDPDQRLALDLERLIRNPAFARISAELHRFTPFRVLRVENYELRHTNTLAWLLDPAGSHQLGDAFLAAFLSKILGPAAALSTTCVEVRSELSMGAGKVMAEEETPPPELNLERRMVKDRLDILIEGRAPGRAAWVVAIEAKIDSQEGERQLLRYEQALQRYFAGVEVHKYYLTLFGADTLSSPNWEQIFWDQHVASVLSTVLDARPDLEPRVREFLLDYQGLIHRLSGTDDAYTGQLKQLANQAEMAPVLRTLSARIKAHGAVHHWDPQPWAACYRRYKVALDACRNEVRDAGATLLWEMMSTTLADNQKWLRLQGKGARALTVRFVPADWQAISALRTARGEWNLFYQAEFRRVQRDVEIKLYVAPPGDLSMQRVLLRQLFGAGLGALPRAQLHPAPGFLKKFVAGEGKTVKLFHQTIAWQERADGTLSAGEQLQFAFAQFEDAVRQHSAALVAAGRPQSVAAQGWHQA